MRFNLAFAVPMAAFAVGMIAPLSAPAAEAADASENAKMEEEVKYVRALVDANMPDFAAPVIAAAKKRWPVLGARLKVLELQGELRLGHFDVVQKVVDGIKDRKSAEYWALRLSMADAYYARGKMPECSRIYREFFAAVPKPGPELMDFFVESGFKWAQMCVNEKNYDEAVRMYGELLAQPLPEERWCAVALENTELLIRLASEITDPKQAKKRADYLAKATVLADKLLWKNELIIVFGKAIAMKAHIELLRGNLAGAQTLINDYMQQLSEIHNSLVEQDPNGSLGYVRMSPMPECRYLLAKVMWESVQAETKKPKPDENMIKDALFGAKAGGKRNGSGVFNHAINVFVKYPESSWAASAGDLAEQVKKLVKARYGKDIKTNVTAAQMKKVRQMQFRNAFEAFRNSDWEKAEKDFLDILRQFPEVEESVDAVANLAEAYIQLSRKGTDAKAKEARRMDADAVEGYLAERFSGLKPEIARRAGDSVLALAAKEHDLGLKAREQQLYDYYFAYYPNHYNAAQMALSLGAKAMADGEWEKAIKAYGRIAEVYTNSTYYATALQCLSICHGKMGDVAGQTEWLRRFAAAATKSADRCTSLLSLALIEQKRGVECFTAIETNAEQKVELAKEGAANLIKAYQDLAGKAGVVVIATAALEDKSLAKKDRDRFLLQREQALYLAGDSCQRIVYPEERVPMFRKLAVKTYEKYLELYPKGKYAPQILVKIGTIHTADKNMEESQKAFARLQNDFPESEEAKNSVPRLAKTLIEMGLKNEGVAQYKQMIATTGGKYSAGQFLAAGEALVEARGYDVAQEAFAKAMDLAKGASNTTAIVARALIGQASAHFHADNYAEAHELLDRFVEQYGNSQLVLKAYEMLVDVASEEGRKEKDDALRMKFFNQAVGAIKKLRAYKKERADQDVLDLESGDVLVRKMEAEESMGLKEQAKETCGRAAATFQAFLMAHEPTADHPFDKMTLDQKQNLERCYSTVLPLMAKLGKSQAEMILKYGNVYMECFPEGKHRTAVQNAINQAKAE